jgi:hypothetical protein
VSARNLDHGLYDTLAEVIVRTDEVTVLDIGVLVYQHAPSQQLPFPKESRIALKLRLGVDPFNYFEVLSKNDDILPLVYSWKILSIFRQTAPFIDTVADGQKIRMRDPQRFGYAEIPRTDAWNDDGGYAEYVLRCELLQVPPKRDSATAMP